VSDVQSHCLDVSSTVKDWDGAYDNVGHIKGGPEFVPVWIDRAAAFRDSLGDRAMLDISYGNSDRQVLDLFMPALSSGSAPRGLVVFIHGGYWKAFDKSAWSWLAQGPLAQGYAVAMPSYTLCPDARINEISQEMARAVEAAASRIDGPVFLTGHSAGGHLVTRLMTTTSSLDDGVARRVAHVLSISGVHDLRPLLKTEMNAVLGLDTSESQLESPVMLEPRNNLKLTCWVGANERPEFIRQNVMLANVWRGLGAQTVSVEAPDRHHFNVIDGLADPDHGLTRALLS